MPEKATGVKDRREAVGRDQIDQVRRAAGIGSLPGRGDRFIVRVASQTPTTSRTIPSANNQPVAVRCRDMRFSARTPIMMGSFQDRHATGAARSNPENSQARISPR